MSDHFTGLAPSDFSNGREAAALSLVASLSEMLSKDENARLGTLVVADSIQADATALTGPESAFVSIGVAESGVTLALNVLTEPHTDVLVDWLDESGSLRTLERLHAFDLVVFDRRPDNYEDRYASKKPKWSTRSQVVERERVALDEIDEHGLETLVASCKALDRRWERVGFSLVRCWPAGQCVLTGMQLLDEIASMISALVPVVGRVNYLGRQAKTSKAPALERASWRKPS